MNKELLEELKKQITEIDLTMGYPKGNLKLRVDGILYLNNFGECISNRYSQEGEYKPLTFADLELLCFRKEPTNVIQIVVDSGEIVSTDLMMNVKRQSQQQGDDDSSRQISFTGIIQSDNH